MFTNKNFCFLWQWFVVTLAALLLLSACSFGDSTIAQPEPTASAPVIIAESTGTMAATAVPVTNGSPQISLDTGGVAAGFQTETVAASSDGPYWELLPEHTHLTLQGYPISNHLLTPQIFIYPVQELQAVNEGATPIIASLQTLL